MYRERYVEKCVESDVQSLIDLMFGNPWANEQPDVRGAKAPWRPPMHIVTSMPNPPRSRRPRSALSGEVGPLRNAKPFTHRSMLPPEQFGINNRSIRTIDRTRLAFQPIHLVIIVSFDSIDRGREGKPCAIEQRHAVASSPSLALAQRDSALHRIAVLDCPSAASRLPPRITRGVGSLCRLRSAG